PVALPARPALRGRPDLPVPSSRNSPAMTVAPAVSAGTGATARGGTAGPAGKPRLGAGRRKSRPGTGTRRARRGAATRTSLAVPGRMRTSLAALRGRTGRPARARTSPPALRSSASPPRGTAWGPAPPHADRLRPARSAAEDPPGRPRPTRRRDEGGRVSPTPVRLEEEAGLRWEPAHRARGGRSQSAWFTADSTACTDAVRSEASWATPQRAVPPTRHST